jgi:hypothetical protein
MATRKEKALPSIALRYCSSNLPSGVQIIFYVPAEEQWRRSLLELSGSLPGGLNQVFPPKTRLNQPGRAFACGVVLEPTTKGALCEFAFVVFLHPDSGLSSLFPPGVCSRTPRLAGCRDERRVG